MISRHHALAVELAERCAPLLSLRDWEHTSVALNEMHDQLQEDLPDESEFEEVFSDMVGNLIDRLGNPEIHSVIQAEIYSRSADSDHRDRATVWLMDRWH